MSATCYMCKHGSDSDQCAVFFERYTKPCTNIVCTPLTLTSLVCAWGHGCSCKGFTIWTCFSCIHMCPITQLNDRGDPRSHGVWSHTCLQSSVSTVEIELRWVKEHTRSHHQYGPFLIRSIFLYVIWPCVANVEQGNLVGGHTDCSRKGGPPAPSTR